MLRCQASKKHWMARRIATQGRRVEPHDSTSLHRDVIVAIVGQELQTVTGVTGHYIEHTPVRWTNVAESEPK